MTPRKSDVFFFFLLQNILWVGLMLFHAGIYQQINAPLIAQNGEMVRVLGLTDLCLFTEARYTRHPALADLSTPFQDHPVSLEHFPSGAIVPVPSHLIEPIREE